SPRRAGNEDQLLAGERGVQAARRDEDRVQRPLARQARPEGRGRRRRDGGSERVIIAPLLQAVAQAAGNGIEHIAQPPSGMFWFLTTLIKMIMTFTIYMVGVMFVIWAERRICAFIQD